MEYFRMWLGMRMWKARSTVKMIKSISNNFLVRFRIIWTNVDIYEGNSHRHWKTRMMLERTAILSLFWNELHV